MIFFCSALLFCITISRVFSVNATSATIVDSVELLYFYSEECDHCRHVDEFVLEPLRETYPIRLVRVCIDADEGYTRLLSEEKAIGDEGNEIPVIFIGNRALGGVEEIEEGLEQAIIDLISGKTAAEERRAPSSQGKGRASEKVKQVDGPDQKGSEGQPVYIAYFTQVGCKECERAYRDVSYLSSRFTQIVIREFDIADPESKTLNEALGKICGVPFSSEVLCRDQTRYVRFLFCPCFNPASDIGIKMTQSGFCLQCIMLTVRFKEMNSWYKFKV